MAHLYYVESLPADARRGDEVVLPPAESRHAAKVSRARIGEEVRLGDGEGLLASGVVTQTAPEVVVRLLDVAHHDRPAVLVGLAQALATGGRDELGVQSATELGVDAVYAWQADRSVSVWRGDKRGRALERWRTIVREAGKQSLRAHVPDVAGYVDSPQLARLSDSWRLVVLDPTVPARLADFDDAGRDILLVVGPEGGFSDREKGLFDEIGAARARLGDTVLRTSTAAPAALTVLNLAFGRLGW